MFFWHCDRLEYISNESNGNFRRLVNILKDYYPEHEISDTIIS